MSMTNILFELVLPFFHFVRKIIAKSGRMIDLFAIQVHRVAGLIPVDPNDGSASQSKVFATMTKYLSYLSNNLNERKFQPKISVLMFVTEVIDETHFLEAIKTYNFQVYKNSELSLFITNENKHTVEKLVSSHGDLFSTAVKLNFVDDSQGIEDTVNSFVVASDGDYITFLGQSDRLFPYTLAELVRSIDLRGESSDIFYSDERVIDRKGGFVSLPIFKPGDSFHLGLTSAYWGSLYALKKELFQSIKGLRSGYSSARIFDLQIRAQESSGKPTAHIPTIMYQRRQISRTEKAKWAIKYIDKNSAVKAVSSYFERQNQKVDVKFNDEYELIDFKPVKFEGPLVSIIVPSKNSLSYIKECVESVFEKSTYKNIEMIVVDNGSTEKEVLDFYESCKASYGEQFILKEYKEYFNFARLNNIGVQASKGEYILLLNNDTRVIAPDWLENMLFIAMRPGVGTVGAKLLYEDGRIQHAGFYYLGDIVAAHVGIESKPDSDLYYNIMHSTHEVGGNTAACMMVKKSISHARKRVTGPASLKEKTIPSGVLMVRVLVFSWLMILWHQTFPEKESIEKAQWLQIRF